MKLTKCVNGHFYDEEKFETCPHCAGTSKLNASSIFGQSSAPKPEAEAGESGFAMPPEEPEFVDVPKETGFTAPPATSAGEEPEFVDAPKETGFTAPPATSAGEELEFVDVPKETGFTAPPEEPEFIPSPEAAPTADASVTAADEEAAFDINSQPSFDTPLDFDDDFAASPVEEETDSTEEVKEEEEEFELLSKYSSDAPAEEAQEASVATDIEAPAWEMPQPSVEEIKTESQEVVESVADSELEEQPTEIVEDAGADLMNGLLSEEEITGNTSQPEFSAEPEVPVFSPEPEASAFSPEPEAPVFSPASEVPAFSPEPEAPAFSPVPEVPAFSPASEVPAFSPEPEAPAFSPASEVPAFSPEPEIPAFSPEPEVPAFSPEPANPAFVPETPASFELPSDEDDDDDGHTVAFYDDIFNEVSKTAVTAAEVPASDAFTEAANAAAEVAMNATATSAVPAASAAEDATAPATSDATATGTVEEPNVFTAPPLPKVQNLPTPCVGWLIALNGAHVGQDFHLRVGKNYVGRDESMDVALTGDKSVSRHKHAIVVYEPKHHKYFVQPGESNELIYVNDEVVLLPMELKPYDLLVIGDIELWFMPLCDAEHNWSEIIRKLQEQMQ